MQKSISYTELSELESAFDAFAEQEKACLSDAERSESLNDFVATYRDGDQFQSVEEFKDAVLNAGAWTFKCDTKEPDGDPYKTAEDMEKNGGTGTGFNGYKMKTTFWQDFTIADKFGADAVQDTFDRAFPEWRGSVVYLTELVLVLNWKIYFFYDKARDFENEAKKELEQMKAALDFAAAAEQSKDAGLALKHRVSADTHRRKGDEAQKNAAFCDELATLYDKLWKQADGFACNNLKGKERGYFMDVTD